MADELYIIVEPAATQVSSRELEELVLDLKSEIEQASNYSIPVNENQRKNEGSLGPEWIPILTAVLTPIASEAAKTLIPILIEWMKRKKVAQLLIKGPSGETKISPDMHSNADAKAITEQVGIG